MCQLLGLSARRPATVNASLEVLAARGDDAGPYQHGWGIAYYEGRDAHCVRDTAPSARSAWVPFLKELGLRSTTIIAHLRAATQGTVALENTQPFCRALGGHRHVFAHNGHLRGIADADLPHPRRHRPIGDTDSEWAFCALLERLDAEWSDDAAPSLDTRVRVIGEYAAALREVGVANFLYTDGEILCAHGHKRMWEPERIYPPGLYILNRECPDEGGVLEGEGLRVESPPRQEVTLVASVPLTDEPWRALEEGELLVLQAGRPLRAPDRP